MNTILGKTIEIKGSATVVERTFTEDILAKVACQNKQNSAEMLKHYFVESVLNGKDEETQEYYFKKLVKARQEEMIGNEDEVIEFAIEEERVIRQASIEKSFAKKLKEIVKAKEGTTVNPVSDRQYETIMAGMRDRVGLDITATQIAFLKKLNFNQASEIIKVLKGISFYNQRVQLSQAVFTLKDREDFEMIYEEVKNNIYRKEWFDKNNDLVRMSQELQPPTDAQVRRIADVARYIETHLTLKDEFGIDVDEFNERPEGKLYYTFNWSRLKEVISEKFNRESASNFIQTYDYITNFYEGNKLEREQINHLRGLYTQLGEYECTKMTYLMTITKQTYDLVSSKLEEQVRYNKIANNEASKKLRETYFAKNQTKRVAREVRSIVLKKEQQEARELTNFVFGIYSCIGQEVPEEMTRILPYFVQGGECKYAGVEEQHYGAFRRMVFDQRNVIKEVDPGFNWGAFIANQPEHILVALGLDFMM